MGGKIDYPGRPQDEFTVPNWRVAEARKPSTAESEAVRAYVAATMAPNKLLRLVADARDVPKQPETSELGPVVQTFTRQEGNVVGGFVVKVPMSGQVYSAAADGTDRTDLVKKIGRSSV